MPTIPKITDIDNVKHTYRADGKLFGLDPKTNRFAERPEPTTTPTAQPTPTPTTDYYSRTVTPTTTPSLTTGQDARMVYDEFMKSGALPGGYSQILENNQVVGLNTPRGIFKPSGTVAGVSTATEEMMTKPKSFGDYQSDAYKRLFPQYSAAIDAITSQYQGLIEEAKARGVQQQGATRAQGAAFGLIGSGEQSRNVSEVGKATESSIGKLTSARMQEISNIIMKINDQSTEIAKMEATQDQKAAENAIALRDKAKMEAKDNVAVLSKSGVTVDALKEKDPTTYNNLLSTYNGDENLLRATFAISKPTATVLDTKTVGSTMYRTTQDPVTGKVTTEHFDLGFTPPVDYNTPQIDEKSGTIVWTPKTPDPNKDLQSQIIVKRYSVPGVGGANVGVGVDQFGNKVAISKQAQAIVEAINNGADMNDLIKGNSKDSQTLRNEVIMGLNAQGGITKKSFELLSEGKDIVDDMINTLAYESMGGYSTILGGQLSTSFGDAMAKASQLSAILSRDNLGLLKGAMSDKDLEFIKAMSSGFDGQGIQSEKYIKDRLTSIQKKLGDKIEKSGLTPQTPNTPSRVEYPIGSGKYYNVDANGDMTPVQ